MHRINECFLFNPRKRSLSGLNENTSSMHLNYEFRCFILNLSNVVVDSLRLSKVKVWHPLFQNLVI